MKSAYDPKKFRLTEKVPYAASKERPIHVPIAVVLGHFEKLTPDELNRLIADLNAEVQRREHHD